MISSSVKWDDLSSLIKVFLSLRQGGWSYSSLYSLDIFMISYYMGM